MAILEGLQGIVGAENVETSAEELAAYSGDLSFTPPRKPSCVARPADAGQVQQIVELANQLNFPLIPVSSGPPHMRGDTVPVTGGVVVDLGRMKEITMIDRPDRVAMVEPGVRFEDLQDALAAEGLRLPMPLCPRATKSVVGSCLEREPHIIPKYHLDVSEPLLCTEVVFGSGDIFHTGESAGPGSIQEQWDAGRRQKSPMGFQTDIYRIIQGSQGTMGIVTWATLRCEVMPQVEKPWLVASPELGNLLDLAYRLVRLRLGDELFILNNQALASLVGDGPGEIDDLRESLPRWVLFYCLAGYDIFPEERIEYQQKDISDIAKVLGVTPTSEAVGSVGAEALLDITKRPSEDPYWRLRYRGGCQEVFFISSFGKIANYMDIAYRTVAGSEYSAPLAFYVQPVNQGHGYHVEFDLAYDPDSAVESGHARELYLSMAESLMKAGAFFSRPYDLLPEMVFNRDGKSTAALRKVKDIFDPAGVMNPGKLCF
ncbi:MAG: FAD-binding oxidoreductase [Actinobacteria bacterium]|nr:FAD-binding oxidoreductase [Actinomycetota bacterium]